MRRGALMSLFAAFLLEMAVPALILGALARGIGLSAMVCLARGVVALFAKYALLSPGQGRLFMADPLGRLGLFLGQSLRAGVIRGPILAVVWLIRALGIEERRSLLMEGKP